MKIKDLPINSPEEYRLSQKFEQLKTESGEIYTLHNIVQKLQSGIDLNEIERHMAAGCILDWIRQHESRKIGRPRVWASAKEKNDFYNARRKKKK